MVGSVRVKICGLNEAASIKLAADLGCDYFGMIHHVKSPRHVNLETMHELRTVIPDRSAVGVVVQPSTETLRELEQVGVDVIQVHFDPEFAPKLEGIRGILDPSVGLWLTPRLAPGQSMDLALLDLCDAVLVDTYSKDRFGGTGRTGNWSEFAELKKAYGDTPLILSGGLTPDNVVEALQQTRADFIDLSSGVESSPGKKSEPKIRAMFEQLSGI
jgi:phosphoribosylanthranilate isomerase